MNNKLLNSLNWTKIGKICLLLIGVSLPTIIIYYTDKNKIDKNSDDKLDLHIKLTGSYMLNLFMACIIRWLYKTM